MCGIVGILRPEEPILEETLAGMLQAVQFRGPDGSGTYVDRAGGVALGHARLAIIDRAGGAQPMTSEDGHLTVVFNGEIFNFQELKSELSAVGFRFRTNSDTEVLLAAYRRWGMGAPSRLNGEFAFAIWDRPRRRLFCARDRFGIRPFFYHADSKGIVFASTLRAILKNPHVPRTLDRRALSAYLSFSFIPAPYSIFEGILKLLPGQILVYEEGRVSLSPYWEPDHVSPKRQVPLNEALEEIDRRLHLAVKRRLISEVPLGAFLSGGIDSTAIVGAMARSSSTPVQTFTIGFPEATHDERRYARQVSQHFATRHTELEVSPRSFDLFPTIVSHMDEPFGDASCLPTFILSELTRRTVSVALSGDGGDELFCGYPKYGLQNWYSSYSHVPAAAHEAIVAAIRGLHRISVRNKPFLERLGKRVQDAALTPVDRYLSQLQTNKFSPGHLRELLLPDIADRSYDASFRKWFDRAPGDPLRGLNLADLRCHLSDQMLVKVDRMAMAHALEVRPPFLDHDLAEYVFSLPFGLKLQGSKTKSLLKLLLMRHFPKEFVYRKKQGFGIPIHRWFREDLFQYLRQRLLDRAVLRNWVRASYVERLLQEHRLRTHEHSEKLWMLLVLAECLEQLLGLRPVPHS